MKQEKKISNSLRGTMIRLADVLCIEHSIIVRIFCQKDGTELMRNVEEEYYKCSECGDIWNWKGED